MPASTPISSSKTAALTRVLDAVSRGYTRFTTGRIDAERARELIEKLHRLHAIGATPAQRVTRKKGGKANAILAIYVPPFAVGADALLDTADEKIAARFGRVAMNGGIVKDAPAEFALLFSPGELSSHEKLREATARPRMQFLGYELVRHAARGRAAWTWRRPSAEMADLYALLESAIHRRRPQEVSALLERAARQPGFHGVRAQTWELGRTARRLGYDGPSPHLFYAVKVSHGRRFLL